jgi:hypothetical protein
LIIRYQHDHERFAEASHHAGRIFCISAPRVGERSISQTSPRRMEILAVQGREGRQFRIRLVIGQERAGGRSRFALGGWRVRLDGSLAVEQPGEDSMEAELLVKRQLLDFADNLCARHSGSLQPEKRIVKPARKGKDNRKRVSPVYSSICV